jgi:hypothetical protein
MHDHEARRCVIKDRRAVIYPAGTASSGEGDALGKPCRHFIGFICLSVHIYASIPTPPEALIRTDATGSASWERGGSQCFSLKRNPVQGNNPRGNG